MYEVLLILHFLGLAMGLGTSFFMTGTRIRAAKLDRAEAARVMGLTGTVSDVIGGVSLLLLWGSGLALVFVYEGLYQSGGLALSIKLVLVASLTVLVALIHRDGKRIRRGQNAKAAAARIQRYGALALLLGVAVVVLAVLAFG